MNPLNQTEEKREAVPNGVSRVGIAALGVLLQVLWIVWAALKLTRYYAWVQLAISVLAFLLALRIYGRHTNSATKLSWIIVILTFPIFGVCLYLLFGRSGAVNIMRGRFTRTDTELQPHYATPLDRAAMPQDPALQNQIHYLQTQAHYPACRNTDVTYYGDTNAALEAQKTDLRKAQHFIFMEYHAIEDSIAWQGIEDILAERAAAGVEVRVFYDDMGRISGYDDYRLFLCTSGAEANENALKLASFHTGRSKALAISKAFHGRTSGAVAVTDNPAISSPFNRTPNVEFTPLNDIGAMRAKLATREFAAVIVEGIQGVAGIHCPTDEFLRAVRAAATETGTQLVLDEIQSGYGRTGRFFAHQAAGIRPDLITTAKGMANGFPIGGVLIAPHFEARPGLLGTTFGGSHLACAAAIAVLEVIERDALVENAAEIGDYLLAELHKIGGLKEVRGRGLMIGIEIDGSGPELRKKLHRTQREALKAFEDSLKDENYEKRKSFFKNLKDRFMS